MLKFNYLVCVITDDGKYGRNCKAQGNSIRYFSETRQCIKGLKILEAKKRVLNFHVTFILLYDSKSGKYGHNWKKTLSNRLILRISRTEHVTNEKFLRRRKTTEKLLLIIRKRTEILGYLMRKGNLEN